MIKICNADLLSALKAAAVAMPSKPLEPVMGGFHIYAEDDWMEVTCTDMAFTITAQTSLNKRIGMADVVVSGKGLLDWCSRVDKGADIIMDIEDDHMTVTASIRGKRKSRSVFATMDTSKFPEMSLMQYVTRLTMPSEELHEAFRSVIHCCAAQSEPKEILKGVNLNNTNGVLETTAIDGFRMAVKTTAYTENSEGEQFNITVPYAFAKAVTGIIPLNGDVDLIIYPSSVCVASGNVTISTRAIKGEYPNVANIMPKRDSSTPTLTVNKEEMLGALNRALLANANNSLVVLTDNDNGTELTVAARSETAQMDEVVSLDNRSGDSVDAAFNGEYLRQAIAAYSDEVQNGLCDIQLVNGGMQAVIDDGSLYQLVLGVRRLKK